MLPSPNAAPSSLLPGRAITLRPHRAALLRINQGRVWATFTGPHRVFGRESGDRFLAPGDVLRVPAGRWLVMEALTDPGDPQSVLFDCTEIVASSSSEGFARQVLEPARELRRSMAHTQLALQRLLLGLLRWSTGHPACPGPSPS